MTLCRVIFKNGDVQVHDTQALRFSAEALKIGPSHVPIVEVAVVEVVVMGPSMGQKLVNLPEGWSITCHSAKDVLIWALKNSDGDVVSVESSPEALLLKANFDE